MAHIRKTFVSGRWLKETGKLVEKKSLRSGESVQAVCVIFLRRKKLLCTCAREFGLREVTVPSLQKKCLHSSGYKLQLLHRIKLLDILLLKIC
jgi:hypothetical protein